MKNNQIVKIAYIINARFPTERGQGVQIAHHVSSFQELGANVTIFAPIRPQTTLIKKIKNLKKFYGINTRLHIVYISAPNPFKFPHQFMAWLSSCVFILKLISHITRLKPVYIYTRDDFIAGIFGILGYSTFYEGHHEPERGSRGHFYWVSKTKGIITNTIGLYKRYKKAGISTSKLLYAPNGVSALWLKQRHTKALHGHLYLPPKTKIIAYAGNLYGWKGLETFIKAFPHLPSTIKGVIIGGLPADQKPLKILAKKTAAPVYFINHQPQVSLAKYLASASALVLPFSASDPHAKNFTSPLKLFEYLSLKIPVVVSNIPSLTKLVSKKEVWFACPDNPKSLAEVLTKVLTKSSAKKINQGYALAQSHTWKERSQTIAEFIKIGMQQ